MDIKRKHRTIMRTSFSKIANELERTMGLSEPDLREIRVSWDLVQQKFEGLRLADENLYEVFLTENVSEQDLEKEVDSCDAYRRKFTLLKFKVEELLQVPSEDGESATAGSVQGSVVVDTSGKRKFKLPKIEFKKYDGNVRDWMPFWSQFKKIHEDKDIDDSDKIQYLIQSTVEGSRARQVVESFPAVNDNYVHIIDALNSRFGREDFQIEVRVRELLGLVINNAIDKNKFDLSILYDRVATQMRSLHTLGVTSDKFSAMLFPLIESCLPQEVLRVWQRSRRAEESGSSLENRLKGLMEFLRCEVENEEKISLAASNFGIPSTSAEIQNRSKRVKSPDRRVPTAMGLINCEAANKCLFCGGSHSTDTCFKAREMPLEQKRAALVEKKACFKCFKIGHQSQKCRKRVQCVVCGRSHGTLICPELRTKRSEKIGENPNEVKRANQLENVVAQSLSNFYEPHVFLQTLRVEMKSNQGSRIVRALIDTGSERSYVLKSTAVSLGYVPKKSETIIHGLFGGGKMEQHHHAYDIRLQSGNYSCRFDALDQATICANVSPVFCGIWMPELKALGINVSDTVDASPIELLIGADVAGRLYTGRRQILRCGLIAIETFLGWTLMGKIPKERENEGSCAISALSLLMVDDSISNLWKLDVLGITDPTVTKSRIDKETEAKDFFSQTVHVNEEGRYEVRLPWVDGHPPLRDNFVIAKRRLACTMAKLKNDNLFSAYQAIFQEWLEEGIIEEVHGEPNGLCHYLPHRPVIKLNSLTTKIRPVFDASAREKDHPSINQCLEKGVNLIELIPTILLRFRQNKIGVVADIKKAFLQISIHPSDRDFLRFLWCDPDGNQIIYRHRRVVFGICSSPFLLGATVEHHLKQCLDQCPTSNELYSRDTILKLLQSFYVDNCVASVPDAAFLERFIRESTNVMACAKFELRGWESPYFSEHCETPTPVLGLSWDLNNDTLQLSAECLRNLSDIETKVLTNRLILSLAQRLFDPIGFCCPAMVRPKLLLQEMWEKKISWDEPISDEAGKKFLMWVEELPNLLEIRIPRWTDSEPGCNLSFHTFCDASSRAYSAVIFLRVEKGTEVKVHLIAAKSRVAPLGKTTIPRLELLAALVGSRLCRDVQNNWDGHVKYIWWSDSSTVLSWIRRQEEWSVFVRNRVYEIRELTVIGEWRYVPGSMNPADLPSRGCSPQALVRSKWWEGPAWLFKPESEWPTEQMEIKEDEISRERTKRVHSLFSGVTDEWHLRYFSKYSKILRMMAWILRFCHNVRNHQNKKQGVLCAEEIESAERFIFKTIQSESFSDKDADPLRTLDPFRDDFGVIRLRTRISQREDTEHFRYPVILPAGHDVVDRLIQYTHEKSCHVGTGGLLSTLRERYWILGGRRNIRRVISKCAICKRQNSKHCIVPTAPLPKNRVQDATAFEVTGVDFAGPLYLKTKSKVWVCVFVCAVYRCVHLELASSLSTEGFIQVLRRFVARRGRPRIIYSDNGTNFVGAENAFGQLDWDRLTEETAVQCIEWRFNPPAAPWWGGFWERLVGVVKQLLKKVLGKACVDYEELVTLLCDCEAVVNSRPLTYLSNDPKELVALTPAMFLRDQVEDGVPDIDAVEAISARKRVAYRNKLRENLRNRFRNEYLGQLKLLYQRDPYRSVSVGDVVLIGNDHSKRLNWPMGRVHEVIPGVDGQIRLARLDTAGGQLLRPLQRLYPVECVQESAGVSEVKNDLQSRVPEKPMTITRSGRVSRPTQRFY